MRGIYRRLHLFRIGATLCYALSGERRLLKRRGADGNGWLRCAAGPLDRQTFTGGRKSPGIRRATHDKAEVLMPGRGGHYPGPCLASTLPPS